MAQVRDKFPERIPFRLTRMLVLCMEVSGVEGVFRRVSEGVMRVLRENKESVMAVLEAFVYDPLLGWRLLHHKPAAAGGGAAGEVTAGVAPTDTTTPMKEDVIAHTDPISGEVYYEGITPTRLHPHTTATTDYLPTPTPSAARPYRPAAPAAAEAEQEGEGERGGGGGGGVEAGVMNAKALSVIARVEAKLLGKDFDVVVRDGGVGVGVGVGLVGRGSEVVAAGGDAVVGGVLDVRSQVDRLIAEATSNVNLCQLYVGWCAFW